MFFCLLLALIKTSTVTLSNIQLNEEEWISPQHDVALETLLTTADWENQFLPNPNSHIGTHATFVDVNSVEKWRVIVVYSDRILLFQEDTTPKVIEYSFPVYRVDYSESGRFIVLSSNPDNSPETGDALRVDLEFDDLIYFDAALESSYENSPYLILNNGAICFARWLDWDNYQLRYYVYNSDLTEYFYFDSTFPRELCWSDSFFLLTDSQGLHCFSENEVLWERSDLEVVSEPYITDDICIIPETTNILILNSVTGDEIESVATSELSSRDRVFYSSSDDVITVFYMEGQTEFLEQVPIVSCTISVLTHYLEENYGASLELPTISGATPFLQYANSEIFLLNMRFARDKTIDIIIDHHGDILFSGNEYSPLYNEDNYFMDQNYRCFPSRTGERALLIVDDSVLHLSIGSQ